MAGNPFGAHLPRQVAWNEAKELRCGSARRYWHGDQVVTQTILAALLPVVFVVALGLLAAKLSIMEQSSAPMFADFVVRFALPLVLLGGVLKISPAAIENGPYLLAMLLGLMVPYVIAFGIAKLLFRHNLSESALQALVCAFPSMAYSGLPVLEAGCGPTGRAGGCRGEPGYECDHDSVDSGVS
jgi:hypothetical protein